jgi:hypothetical protein
MGRAVIDIRLDQRALAGLLGTIKALGDLAPQAIARGINRATDTGKTAMVRAMAKETGLTGKNIAREIKIHYASKTTQVAKIWIRGRPIPLIAFQARGPEPSRGRGRGVSYRKPGGGRGRKEGAFISTMPSGHRGVYERAGKPRLPIRELFGPALPDVFEQFLPLLQEKAGGALEKNVTHELEFALSKVRK